MFVDAQETLDEHVSESASFNAPGVDDDDAAAGDDAASQGQNTDYHTDDADDISQFFWHYYNPYLQICLFHQALELWCDTNGISRSSYQSLREILHLLRDITGRVHPDVATLPSQFDTLKQRFRSRLPLINMRKAVIPVKVAKLPTEPESKKRDHKGNIKAIIPVERRIINITMHFFDPASIFIKVLSSHLGIHHGNAIFVDLPTELYHSHAWASSIRASEGRYPHLKFPSEDESADSFVNGAVIFPSDFIYYRCINDLCACQNEDDPFMHIGRVYGFGFDRRSSPCVVDDGTTLTLQIQEALPPHSLPSCVAEKLPNQHHGELVLKDDVTYIPETHAWTHVAVFVDRSHGETHDNPTPSQTFLKRSRDAELSRDKFEEAKMAGKPSRRKPVKPPVAYPKYDKDNTTLPVRTEEQFVVRFVFDADYNVTPMCHTDSLCAELEIREFGRDLFEGYWKLPNQVQSPQSLCHFLPLLTHSVFTALLFAP